MGIQGFRVARVLGGPAAGAWVFQFGGFAASQAHGCLATDTIKNHFLTYGRVNRSYGGPGLIQIKEY